MYPIYEYFIVTPLLRVGGWKKGGNQPRSHEVAPL